MEIYLAIYCMELMAPCVKISMHAVQYHHCKVQGSKLITLESTLHGANTMKLQLNLLIDLQNIDS